MTRISEKQHKQALVMRLKRIEGQLRGIQRLVEEEASCEAIAQQLSAATRALEKAHNNMLACLIEAQLTDRGLTPSEAKPVVDIVSRFG
jgi:DNA-binding FrmR family transcriptional regulator